MMASPATNSKSDMEPVIVVEKDHLEKAEGAIAAQCVDEKPVDVIAAAACGDNASAPAAREGRRLTPLPKDEVECVLSWKWGQAHERPLHCRGRRGVRGAERQLRACAWMNAEYEANGVVVLVDDEFLWEQAEDVQLLKDFWEDHGDFD